LLASVAGCSIQSFDRVCVRGLQAIHHCLSRSIDIARASCELEAMRRRTAWGFLVTAAIALFIGCQSMAIHDQKEQSNMRVHYVEIVCRDVAAQCAALERIHHVSFGPLVADLGQARVAEASDGSLIGVRAPLAEHEQPIVRTYLAVADIARAVEEAEAAGAVIAYPPTRQGDTGTWAIYYLGEVQLGLWQR
jgi:predicted enzyme related to lactoylglutathione lyase